MHMRIGILGLIGAALLLACANPRVYVNEEADFGFYTTVGVVPFTNVSQDRAASEKVTSSFITELLIEEGLAIAPSGDFLRAYRGVVKEDRPNVMDDLSLEECTIIGETGKVQGFFVGTVRDFGMARAGTQEYPLVAITVRFIDCQSGKVIWSFESSRRGGPKFFLFSPWETHTLGAMTTTVTRSAARSFLQHVK